MAERIERRSTADLADAARDTRMTISRHLERLRRHQQHEDHGGLPNPSTFFLMLHEHIEQPGFTAPVVATAVTAVLWAGWPPTINSMLEVREVVRNKQQHADGAGSCEARAAAIPGAHAGRGGRSAAVQTAKAAELGSGLTAAICPF